MNRFRVGFFLSELYRCVTNHFNPLPPSDAVRKQEHLEDLFSSVLLHFKKYQPLGNLKFNNLGIFQSLKLRILAEKTVLISRTLNFTPNNLSCCGLRYCSLLAKEDKKKKNTRQICEIYGRTTKRVHSAGRCAEWQVASVSKLNVSGALLGERAAGTGWPWAALPVRAVWDSRRAIGRASECRVAVARKSDLGLAVAVQHACTSCCCGGGGGGAAVASRAFISSRVRAFTHYSALGIGFRYFLWGKPAGLQLWDLSSWGCRHIIYLFFNFWYHQSQNYLSLQFFSIKIRNLKLSKMPKVLNFRFPEGWYFFQ